MQYIHNNMRILLSLLLLAISLSAQSSNPSPEALAQKGHYKSLRTLAEQRFRENPRDAETLWMMSVVKQQWKDLAAAIDFAEKAVAADPKSARYHLRLADVVGNEAGQASKLRQLGLARRFKRELETVLSLDPRSVEALRYLMEYDLQAPGIVGGDKNQARAIPGQIMLIDPVAGANAQARLAYLDKQPERVEGFFRKAVEARPASPEAHLALGNYCLSPNVKKNEEAEKEAREALRIDADLAGGHGLLAVSLVRQSKWKELDGAMAAAEKAVPDNLSPYFRAAANCLQMNVELPRAEQYLRKYLGQEPEPNMQTHAAARLQLGRVLEKENRRPEAIAEYQAAVNMDPNSPARADLKRLR